MDFHRKTTNSSFPNHRHGFSLVEMLVVIAVIGVIAAIALPNIGSVNGSAQTAVGKRRAQEIVSVFAAGQAAGVPSFLAASSVRTAQDAVGTGGYGEGNMSGVFFKVQGVTQNEDNAKPVPARTGYYLGWSNGSLVYDSAGGHFN